MLSFEHYRLKSECLFLVSSPLSATAILDTRILLKGTNMSLSDCVLQVLKVSLKPSNVSDSYSIGKAIEAGANCIASLSSSGYDPRRFIITAFVAH